MEDKKTKRYYFIIDDGKFFGNYITIIAENKSIATKFAEEKLIEYNISYSKKEPLGVYMGTLIQHSEDFYRQNLMPNFL